MQKATTKLTGKQKKQINEAIAKARPNGNGKVDCQAKIVQKLFSQV